MKEFARTACLIGLLYGAFYMWYRPNDGPITFTFRLCLFFGGGIGLFFLGLPSRSKQEPTPQPLEEKDAGSEVVHVESAMPKWRGDAEGNRKRLIVIIIVLAAICAGFAIFLSTQSGELRTNISDAVRKMPSLWLHLPTVYSLQGTGY